MMKAKKAEKAAKKASGEDVCDIEKQMEQEMARIMEEPKAAAPVEECQLEEPDDGSWPEKAPPARKKVKPKAKPKPKPKVVEEVAAAVECPIAEPLPDDGITAVPEEVAEAVCAPPVATVAAAPEYSIQSRMELEMARLLATPPKAKTPAPAVKKGRTAVSTAKIPAARKSVAAPATKAPVARKPAAAKPAAKAPVKKPTPAAKAPVKKPTPAAKAPAKKPTTTAKTPKAAAKKATAAPCAKPSTPVKPVEPAPFQVIYGRKFLEIKVLQLEILVPVF